MGSQELSSGAARVAALCIAVVMTALIVACSDDPADLTEEPTSSAATTTLSPPSTTGVVTTEAIPTSTVPTPTTAPFPGPVVLLYLEDMQGLAVRIGELVLDMRAANNDWDNRVKTYQETETALENVERTALALRGDIGLIEPPPDRGLPVEHQTAWVAVGQMADAAVDSLAGLRSPDTGERRQAALGQFLVAYERYAAAFGRIVEIVGVAANVSLPSVATTSVPTTEATTTTTQASATTTTTAAATTSTTEASDTTSTTAAAATTSTTEAPGTGTETVPPAPDIYEVLTENPSPFQGADRTWLTVRVDAGATKSELAQIGNRLAFEYRVAQQYQALAIYFVHFPEGVDTLGTWIHAPYGDWTRAAEASRGDYTQHQVVDRTVEKDWTLLPTDAQVDLYRRYREYKANLLDSGDTVPPDDELIPVVAQEFEVTTAELRGAVEAWEAWEAR